FEIEGIRERIDARERPIGRDAEDRPMAAVITIGAAVEVAVARVDKARPGTGALADAGPERVEDGERPCARHLEDDARVFGTTIARRAVESPVASLDQVADRVTPIGA